MCSIGLLSPPFVDCLHRFTQHPSRNTASHNTSRTTLRFDNTLLSLCVVRQCSGTRQCALLFLAHIIPSDHSHSEARLSFRFKRPRRPTTTPCLANTVPCFAWYGAISSAISARLTDDLHHPSRPFLFDTTFEHELTLPICLHNHSFCHLSSTFHATFDETGKKPSALLLHGTKCRSCQLLYGKCIKNGVFRNPS